MQTKRIWLFSAHLLPLVARLCLVPLETIVFINKFSMIFTGLEVIYFLASNLLVPYNLAKTAYRELAQVIKWLCVFELHAGLTAFEHDGPERDFLICRINVLPSLPPSYLMSMCLCSPRWWKSTACWLWGCLCGTSWSCQFFLCVSGFCCLPCRSTRISAPEISLPQEKGSCFSFLPGKTTAAPVGSSVTMMVFINVI